MPLKKSELTKQPVLNIGLVGHIDHGKTTLLQKLTGKWADTHSEELKRGITIKLGYADLIINNKKFVSFIDVPGHEMLMATMLCGAAIIDAAILVIATNEGIKPQTREHLTALQAKGIKEIIIVQNKLDLVTKEEAKKNYEEIKKFVKETVAENAPIVPVSAQQGINVDLLIEEIDKLKIPKRDIKSQPLFFVARSFDINKPGTNVKNLFGGILGGILKQGILKVGDEIEIKPGRSKKKHDEYEYIPLKAKIIGLMSGKSKLKELIPSGNLAIQTSLDPRLSKTDSLAGCVVGLKGKVPDATSEIKIKINLFERVVGSKKETEVEKLKTAEHLLLSINTSITIGTIKKIRENEAQLTLKIPIVPIKNSRVGIARNIEGKWRLIGWGELI